MEREAPPTTHRGVEGSLVDIPKLTLSNPLLQQHLPGRDGLTQHLSVWLSHLCIVISCGRRFIVHMLLLHDQQHHTHCLDMAYMCSSRPNVAVFPAAKMRERSYWLCWLVPWESPTLWPQTTEHTYSKNTSIVSGGCEATVPVTQFTAFQVAFLTLILCIFSMGEQSTRSTCTYLAANASVIVGCTIWITTTTSSLTGSISHELMLAISQHCG